MSDRASRLGRATVLLVVASVLVAAVAPAAVAIGGGADETADSGSIGPGIQSTNGTVEVIVRFEGPAETSPKDASADETTGPNGSATLSTSDLKTNAASAQADFERFAERKPGVSVKRSFWLANAMLVTIDTESVAVERLLDVRGVERLHENFEVRLDSAASAGGAATSTGGPTAADTASATATSTNATYGVEMVRAPEVWKEFDTRGEGATVAVLDTGIDPDHPDLNVSGWAEYDSDGNLVSEGPENAYDDGEDGHGTHVAGTVAGDNASGTAIGVAPGAELYGIKVLGSDGSGSFGQVIAGMEYATENDSVDVLQMSLGANKFIVDFIEPVRNSRDAGKIVVASSGNSGQGTSSSPGNIYDSLAVGAVDSSQTVAGTSSGENVTTADDWGSDAPGDWPAEYVVPDVSAPGVSVNSSLPGGGYGLKSGTSMAAPHASGVAALVLSSTSKNVSDDELYDAIRSTADHPDNATEPDTRYGTGIVDAYAAVSSTKPFYDVSDIDSPPIVERNGTINATVNVTNVDPIPGDNRTLELRLTDPTNESDVRELNATNVSIGAGNATTVRLNGTVPSDFGTGETTVAVASPEDNVTATVRVADAVGSVNGTVIDAETNATLSGIDVIVENGTETVGETTTDGNGTYAVDVPAANLSVTASNATYAPANATVELNGSGDAVTANVSLALRNGTLGGFVNASDGLGLPTNATVTVTNETNVTVAAVDTSEDGSYAVDLRPGSYNVTAEAPDFHPDARTDVTVGPNATTDPGLELDPKAATVSGTVTNASSGDPIDNVTVSSGSASAETDAAGNYSLAIDRGDRTVTVSADGYAESSKSLTLAANESREANFSLAPTAVFEVTSVAGPNEIEQGSSGEFAVDVRNDGRTVGDVTVTAAVSPSGTVDPPSRSFSDVGVGATRSTTVTVSISDSASTGQHDLTASVADDTRTRSFDVVSGEDDGGETTNTGGGGGGGGGGEPTAPADEEGPSDPKNETNDSTNQTDAPTNETDGPANQTDAPTNETDGPANQTDALTNETGVPVADATGAVGDASGPGGG
ncbi:S8 family serine peptidase, partial [Halorubrum sp. Boch-26]|uniref:S8 family serine peptidase n=1 Tax=Halorubrum sp. Boch-26 TaxID=2994426 RepID=UPI002468F20E